MIFVLPCQSPNKSFTARLKNPELNHIFIDGSWTVRMKKKLSISLFAKLHNNSNILNQFERLKINLFELCKKRGLRRGNEWENVRMNGSWSQTGARSFSYSYSTMIPRLIMMATQTNILNNIFQENIFFLGFVGNRCNFFQVIFSLIVIGVAGNSCTLQPLIFQHNLLHIWLNLLPNKVHSM